MGFVMMIMAVLIASFNNNSISFVNSASPPPSSLSVGFYEKCLQLEHMIHEQELVKNMTLNIAILEENLRIFHDCCVQDLESDTHLTLVAESLNKARGLISPPAKKASNPGDGLLGLAEVVNKEHKKLLARKSIVQKRKEVQERQLLEMELEEETKTVEAEKMRLAKESYEREQERIKREQEEQEIEKLKDLITDKQKKTKQEIIDMAMQEQLKERQELEKRLAKTMDHMERARKEEEAPLMDAAFHRRLLEGKLDYESGDGSSGVMAPQEAPKPDTSSGMQIFWALGIFFLGLASICGLFGLTYCIISHCVEARSRAAADVEGGGPRDLELQVLPARELEVLPASREEVFVEQPGGGASLGIRT